MRGNTGELKIQQDLRTYTIISTYFINLFISTYFIMQYIYRQNRLVNAQISWWVHQLQVGIDILVYVLP